MQNSDISAQLEKLILMLEEARDDAKKVDGGQAGAPGRRIRKVAQDVSKGLKTLRADVLERRKS